MIKPYHETEHGVLYHGEASEILKQIPDNSIDMILTSPPYDNLRTYTGFTFDFEGIAKELFRVLKQGGVCVWIVGDATINGSETGTSFKQALYFKEIGFNLHDTMIYQKNVYPFSPSNRYFSVFEYMFILTKGEPITTNLIRVKTNGYKAVTSSSFRQPDGSKKSLKYAQSKDTRIKENVWIYEVGYAKTTLDNMAYEHPAIFPEQLAIDHIISWSNENNTVLDCFMGSGTTAKACIRMKRKYIGIDISSEYCEIAAKRIETTLDQTEIELS